MNISQLKRGGFLGSLAARMTRTEPGRLAHAIDQIVYDMVREEIERKGLSIKAEVLMAPREVYAQVDWAIEGGSSEKVETEKVLREVFHYLEACALREVSQ